MNDSILFEEKPTKAKKNNKSIRCNCSGLRTKPKPSIFGDNAELNLFSSDLINKQESNRTSKGGSPKKKQDNLSPAFTDNTEINLFGSSDLISNKQTNKANKTQQKGQGNIISVIYKEHPELKNYLLITEPQNYSLTKEQQRKKLDESLELSILNLKEISDEILQLQKKIDQKKMEMSRKIDEVKSQTKQTIEERSARLICCDISIQIYHEHEKTLDDLSNKTMGFLNFISILRKDYPDIDVKINVNLIKSELNCFPEGYPKAEELIKQKHYMKNHLMHFVKNQTTPINESLNEIFTRAKAIFDADMSYFIDTGIIEGDFANILKHFNHLDKENINKSYQRFIDQPNQSGVIIIKQCEETMKTYHIEKDYLSIIFLLFTRYFFSKLYIQQLRFSFQTNTPKSLLYSERIIKLRKLSAVGFGFAQQFLPKSLITIPLEMFPKNNEYSESISALNSLKFCICPIDFCYELHKAFKLIQLKASEISFQKKSEETGKFK